MTRVALWTCAAVTIAAAAIASAQQPSQQPPPYVERVDVSSVVVDVRVIDDYGSSVLGLTTPDFFVTIGGKPAKVQSSFWTGTIADAPTFGKPDAPVFVPASRPETGQLIVLLFQKSLIHDRARGFIRMVEQSRSLVRDLRPSDRMAILVFDTSLRVYSDFTNDRESLDRILARGLLHEKPPKTVAAGSPSLLGATAGARRISSIERAFEMVGEALKPLPGSKAIAFIGYGMGTPPFGQRQDTGPREVHAAFGSPMHELASNGDMNSDYTRAWRAMTAARVSVFSLDISQADTHTLASGMQAIAADTGGFYASSLDFPEKPMHFFAGALKGHYVLFVEPPADATDRRLDVSVAASRRAYVYSTSSYKSEVR